MRTQQRLSEMLDREINSPEDKHKPAMAPPVYRLVRCFYTFLFFHANARLQLQVIMTKALSGRVLRFDAPPLECRAVDVMTCLRVVSLQSFALVLRGANQTSSSYET